MNIYIVVQAETKLEVIDNEMAQILWTRHFLVTGNACTNYKMIKA